MNTVSKSPPRRSPLPQQSKLPVFDPGSLAYEDVVALAARLSKNGYAELGADFLAFANSPTGLASLYGMPVKTRGFRRVSVASQDTMAAMPYLAAATILLRSKTLRRTDVGKAVLLIELGKATAAASEDAEDDQPLFMD